jgi:hypothetical protein
MANNARNTIVFWTELKPLVEERISIECASGIPC